MVSVCSREIAKEFLAYNFSVAFGKYNLRHVRTGAQSLCVQCKVTQINGERFWWGAKMSGC